MDYDVNRGKTKHKFPSREHEFLSPHPNLQSRLLTREACLLPAVNHLVLLSTMTSARKTGSSGLGTEAGRLAPCSQGTPFVLRRCRLSQEDLSLKQNAFSTAAMKKSPPLGEARWVKI